MSTLEVIESKISFIEKHLKRATKYQRFSLVEIQKDDILQNAVERELYLISQAVLDLSQAMVAYKKFRRPTAPREALDILGEHDILPGEFIGRFSRIAGFRNALAHAYEDLDLNIVYDVLHHKLSEVEEFLRYIKQSL